MNRQDQQARIIDPSSVWWRVREWTWSVGRCRVVTILFGACVLTILLDVSNADLWIAGLFFDHTAQHWPFLATPAMKWFDNAILVPSICLAVLGPIFGLVQAIRRRSNDPLRFSIFVLLVLAIGPGLLVNGMKRCWGRPRPHDVVMYGGDYEYSTVWDWGDDRYNCRSFPSGHAAMGFFLMTPMFYYRRSRPKLARLFLFCGLAGGIFIGLERIIQGSHFVTDVLWSATLVYVTGALLSRCFFASYDDAPETVTLRPCSDRAA